jgi:hypothetical protein
MRKLIVPHIHFLSNFPVEILTEQGVAFYLLLGYARTRSGVMLGVAKTVRNSWFSAGCRTGMSPWRKSKLKRTVKNIEYSETL